MNRWCMDGWMDGWMGGWRHRCMDAWMVNEWRVDE